MKFSVGYTTGATDQFLKEIVRLKKDIWEVYFSWGAAPSGRNAQTRVASLTPWEAQAKQLRDLAYLHGEGLAFNLLFNANCYGDVAQSKSFFVTVGETVEYIASHFSLASVTTTSPLVAKFLKQNFKELDVRASVNMGVGSVKGMEYVSELFDSFYVKRELNRDLNALQVLRDWCDQNGKEMYLLANSGCLNDCAAHTFHDNLVAHEAGASKMDNGYQFEGLCRPYLAKNKAGLLDATNYVRPEDVELFEHLTPAMKLATRVHERPERVLRAYIEKKSYCGNMAELLEPNHAGTIYPYVLENGRIERVVENGKLIYQNAENAFVKLEENYAYQQND
ncbi:MAG: hypothetical protein IKC75_06680 [Clostridia bacterium]|nr:hypothetical protein [Clostridia bacterium]